jgi:hypothetical protein
LRTISSLFARVLLFALGFAILQVVGIILPGSHVGIDFVTWSYIGGIFIGGLLSWVLSKTRLRALDLAALVWLVLFVVQQFSNIVEGYFFTSLYSTVSALVAAIFLSLLKTLAEAILAVALFTPQIHDRSLFSEFSSYFKERPPASWGWRIPVSAVAYFPIYFFFGALIIPFVLPYYNNPTLGLRIPPFTVIIPLEFFRGLLYVVSLLGIFAAVKASRRMILIMAASVLFVPGALVPLLQAMAGGALPQAIVPFHLVEILADSVVYGAVTAHLLGRINLKRKLS